MTGAPHPPAPDADPADRPGSARRWLRAAIQLVGFAAGLALLAWCASEAFSDENRAQLERLREAPATIVGALVALSALSLILNGLIFWVTLAPVRRISVASAITTNALGTFLAYLPMKLSVAARFLLHRTRDGVPVAQIGGWFAAVGVILIATMAPLGAVSFALRRVDLVWGAALGAALVLSLAITIIGARILRTDAALARARRTLLTLHLGFLERLTRTETFEHLHSGLSMLAHPGATIASAALRLADVGAQAARFLLAAAAVGATLPADDAILVASVYFLIGVFSPAGTLGVREAGAAGAATLLGVSSASAFATVALVVGAAEAITNLACAGAAVAWLRPDRMLRARQPQ
ncbi:MAG: lysylphosphatidylglycerol synthase domain-containing protein [Phycisphaerales bacterium JB039]